MEEAIIIRDQTLFEKIHDIGTNLMFSVSSWSQRSIPFNREDEVVFQGQKMNDNKENYQNNLQETIERFQNTIWITYRKNFPTLLASLILESSIRSVQQQQELREYVSDTGWGCMVRVGQMTFAEVLRRHLITKNLLPSKPTKAELQPVIEAFLDEDTSGNTVVAPYSIQKIARIAFAEFNLCPGEWYTPSRICYVLGLLHNQNASLAGTEDLKIALFSSSQPIIWEDFLEAMCKVDPERNKQNQLCREECCCSKITSISQSSPYGNKLLKPKETTKIKRTNIVCERIHENQFSLLAFIVCRIGVDSPESEFLKVAIKMMDFKCSLGMIGGRPRKALYFLGRVGDEFMYLDPHYVQESSNQRNIMKAEQLESFFCSKFQLYPSNRIDSSFSFAFYFNNLADLNEFYVFINKLKKDNPEFFFLMFKDENPKGQAKGTSSNILSQKNIQREAEEKAKRVEMQQQQQQQKLAQDKLKQSQEIQDDDDDDDFEII